MSLGDALGGLPIIGPTIVGPKLADGYNTHAAERMKYAQKLREQAGKYDPAEEARYQGAMEAPVNDAFSRAARGAAQQYAARGMSASPVAAATQAGAAGERGQVMQRVQTQAQDAARASLRQRTLDQYGAETGSWRQDNAASLADAQANQAENQAAWDALVGLGQEGISSSRALQRERDRYARRQDYYDYLNRYNWASGIFDNPDNFG